MLQKIRERLSGGFALVLLGLLLVPFVFFGIGNFSFLGLSWAAVVEGNEISVAELENAYQNQLLELPNYGNLPPETLRLIRQTTLERLIRQKLLEHHVADEGYRVGNDQVIKVIQNEPTFQQDGKFDRNLYDAFLAQRVIDAPRFEALQRQNFRERQFQLGVGASAFVTPAEYRRYLNLYAEQRLASVAIFDIAALADTVVVSDEDVQEYYDSHPDEFVEPESVDFEYLELNRDELAADIQIPDDALQTYYEQNADRFRQDEQRRARHILITLDDGEAAAEELATSLAARAQAGEPFEDLARQYSKDGGTAEQGGDLGILLQSQMPGALGDAIFSIEAGETYGPVRTDFGFHVVKVEEIVDGGPRPLDQVRGELLQEMRAEAVEDRIRDLEDRVADATFDAQDLQGIAATTGLAVKQASGFTLAGGEPFGSNQTVIDAVFDPLMKDDRQISDIVEIDATRSIVVHVIAHHEAARRPLEEVKETIVFSLQSQRALNMIEDRSRRLADALLEGADFEKTANELGAQFTPDVALSRFGSVVDPVLQDLIFRTPKPSPGKDRMGSTVTSQGDYAVFLLHSVVPGMPESIPLAERDQGKDRLEQSAGIADLNAYMNELVRTADIERSEAALAGTEPL